MLAHFNSEAELAGVLSHEIAHITARHAVRGMSTAQVTNLLIGLAASSVPGGSISNSGFNLLNQIVNKGYSRKYESEADDIANGKILNVKGDGVVGEFPTLQPGESFEYTSGTPLKTNNGIMQGFYLMSQARLVCLYLFHGKINPLTSFGLNWLFL